MTWKPVVVVQRALERFCNKHHPNLSCRHFLWRDEKKTFTYFLTPIILTKTLQLGSQKKQTRRGVFESIPEYETTKVSRKDVLSELPLQISDYSNHKPEREDYKHLYSGTEFLECEDEELSWFNAFSVLRKLRTCRSIINVVILNLAENCDSLNYLLIYDGCNMMVDVV